MDIKQLNETLQELHEQDAFPRFKEIFAKATQDVDILKIKNNLENGFQTGKLPSKAIDDLISADNREDKLAVLARIAFKFHLDPEYFDFNDLDAEDWAWLEENGF